MRLLWKYTLTDCAVHVSVAKAIFSLTIEFSILECWTTSLDTIHAMYVILSGVLFCACLPPTVLHDSLRPKFLV